MSLDDIPKKMLKPKPKVSPEAAARLERMRTAAIGAWAFGSTDMGWQSRLAEKLGCTVRLVQAWIDPYDERMPPPKREKELRRALIREAGELLGLASKLE